MFDRKLLAKLSRCAWKVLNLYLTQAIPYDDAKAGAAVAVQSFGDFQNFNSHLHVICTDGCFYGNGSFKACPTPHPKDLEDLFRFEVLKMLKSEGKINDLIDSDLSPQAFRKNWARLIQKIYHVDPLLCPKCFGPMRIIAFIDDEQLVKKILKHLDLWEVKRKPPPRSNDPPSEAIIIYDKSSSPSADDPPSISSRDKFRLRFCFFGVISLPSVMFLRRDKLHNRC